MLKQKRKVVISLHGINTHGAWQKDVASIISEQGWVYFPLNYGKFSVRQFLSKSERQKKINWFRDEFDYVHNRIKPLVPSVIAHSFGTLIICNSLEKFPGIRLDKLILCGSIVRRDFDWPQIIAERKQITTVENDIAGQDFWAGICHKFIKGTGPSGTLGFTQKHERLSQPEFSRYEHSDCFGYDHYEHQWIPFLEKEVPYVGEKFSPSENEEPVSPVEAARWSALTYYHQFISRAALAIRQEEIFPLSDANSPEQNKAFSQPLKVNGLIIAIPEKPGGATQGAVSDFSKKLRLQDAAFGRSPRTIKYGSNGWLYDLPSILQTLSFLDHRRDDELGPAVTEFQRMLENLLNGPRSDCRELIKIKRVSELLSNL